MSTEENLTPTTETIPKSPYNVPRWLRYLFIVVYWILGMPQNLFGLFYLFIVKEKHYYNVFPNSGKQHIVAKYTRFIRDGILWNSYRYIKTNECQKGFSAGMYLIFMMHEGRYPSERALIQENGHRLLSMIVGPLHIFLFGLPRFIHTIWFNTYKIKKLRAAGKSPAEIRDEFNKFYVERIAIYFGNL